VLAATNGSGMSTTIDRPSAEYFLSARDVEATYGVDLITGEVLRHALIDVTRQMHGSMLRAAFSAIVRE
jgi:hypothetical protein